MNAPHLPWLELAILVPLLGAWWVGRLRSPEATRRWGVLASGLAFVCTAAACLEFHLWPTDSGAAEWSLVHWLTGRDFFALDQLSAPLLPMAALLYLLTGLAT